jgi:Flp pilus assembly pilin Flp
VTAEIPFGKVFIIEYRVPSDIRRRPPRTFHRASAHVQKARSVILFRVRLTTLKIKTKASLNRFDAESPTNKASAVAEDLSKGEGGSTTVEHGLMVALIALLCVVAVATITKTIKNKFVATSSAIGKV